MKNRSKLCVLALIIALACQDAQAGWWDTFKTNAWNWLPQTWQKSEFMQKWGCWIGVTACAVGGYLLYAKIKSPQLSQEAQEKINTINSEYQTVIATINQVTDINSATAANKKITALYDTLNQDRSVRLTLPLFDTRRDRKPDYFTKRKTVIGDKIKNDTATAIDKIKNPKLDKKSVRKREK